MNYGEVFLGVGFAIVGIAIMIYNYLIYKGYCNYERLMDNFEEKHNDQVNELEDMHKKHVEEWNIFLKDLEKELNKDKKKKKS